MKLYLLPIQQVLLEYVIKLGEVIFFPGTATSNDVEASRLNEEEKETLKEIITKNKEFFSATGNAAYILITSKYDAVTIKADTNILNKIFQEANRSLDYIRILECPFSRPEFFLGVPGLLENKKYIISIDANYKLEFYLNGEEYYYSMQKGFGLDIGATEFSDPVLYNVLFSNRKDEVYHRFRNLLAEACEALRIVDESRCFVYLFSKVDGMGLCDSFHFQENKKRVVSVIAANQHEFDTLSSELYFYSKEIRTEVVHKGRKIDELVSLDKARYMNQVLFNVIIKYCCAVINTGVDRIDLLKEYIAKSVDEFSYKTPEKQTITELPSITYPLSTYIAFVEGIELSYPQKRGNMLLLPKISVYGWKKYYHNYISKDQGGPIDEEFCEFTIDDFEYILEILSRLREQSKDAAMVIGYHLPRVMDDYMSSVKLREQFVDYICNKMNEIFYYDMLNFEDGNNRQLLPPRPGLKDGLRIIYEFVEDEAELYVRAIPGRAFGEYQIPEEDYLCVNTERDGIYKLLYENDNYISETGKRTLINLCESEYIHDWTQRISYLFDIFDGIDPRTYDGAKAVKLLFTFISVDKNDYIAKKREFEDYKIKYRNPILHGGKAIYSIESSEEEIMKLDRYMRSTILEYCLKIDSLKITSWEELDEAYRNQQRRLGI